MGVLQEAASGLREGRHWGLAILMLAVAWLARNRYCHGLHRFPGPFLASLTDWWRLAVVWGGRPDLVHRRLHARYGDVVRLGPNMLSFASPEALRDIYGLNKGFTKSDFYLVQQNVARGERLPSLFSSTDNDFHARYRRCINGAFSMSSLVQYEPLVDRTTRLFLDQTERIYATGTGGGGCGDGNGCCDMARWLQFYAFDVIGELTYTKRHGFLERNEDIDGIVQALDRMFQYAAVIGQLPSLDLLLQKNPVYLKLSQWGLFEATMPVARFAGARLKERVAAGTAANNKPAVEGPVVPEPIDEPSTAATGEDEGEGEDGGECTSEAADGHPHSTPPADLLSKFLAAQRAHPAVFTDMLVLTTCVSMAFADSDTTAVSLSAVLYHLLRGSDANATSASASASTNADSARQDHQSPGRQAGGPLAYLRAELDAAAREGRFADNTSGLVTWAESQTLPYLDACVREAFRLHPAVGLPLERVVPPRPGGGVQIAGRFVPAGTIVGVSAWVLHRRPEVWGSDAEEYRPERWLEAWAAAEQEETEEGTKETKETRKSEGPARARLREMNACMLHFGMGSRTCLGKNISLLEIYKVIPSLLRRFDIQLQNPEEDWKLVNAWFVKTHNFMVTFKVRHLVQPDFGLGRS